MKVAPRKLRKWPSAGTHRSYAEKRNRIMEDVEHILEEYEEQKEVEKNDEDDL